MAVHHVPRRDLHDALQRITRDTGERVQSVTPDPDDTDCFIVLTDGEAIETRAS